MLCNWRLCAFVPQRPRMDLRQTFVQKHCLPAKFNPLHATVIDDNLVVGSKEAASHLELLRYYGITHVCGAVVE